MSQRAMAFGLLLFLFLLSACGASAEQRTANAAAGPGAGQAPASASQTAARPPRAPVDPNRLALIVAGVGGEESYTKKFTQQAVQMFDALTQRWGFDEKRVYLLAENAVSPETAPGGNLGRATADEVRNAFNAIKSAASADSLLMVVLIGHGSFDQQDAKFNLVGRDLTAKDYAALLDSLPTRRVVFINCASASGEFVKPLAGEGRVIISATRSGNEQNATVFADHLLAALDADAADADKNGRVSVLEIFNYATKLTADWYKQKDRLASEHALLEDNGDGTGHEEAAAGDGGLAKTIYLDTREIEIAGDDPEMVRLLTERQRLEEAVEKLKARKEQMQPEAYEAELERLLVELAQVSRSIKARQK